jgi:hypothetical protein
VKNLVTYIELDSSDHSNVPASVRGWFLSVAYLVIHIMDSRKIWLIN